MTIYARKGDGERWVEAVLASLCYQCAHQEFIYGIESESRCGREWCRGVIDVVNRVNVDMPIGASR